MLPPGILPHDAVHASNEFTSYDSVMDGQVPKPPRRPLTPYMRYSKSIWKSVKEGKDEIWQSVKEANPSLSVCEIGATIGKMWRELDDVTKQKYNEDFIQDKARYDEELQAYLKVTGLQASDLAKPKGKKKADANKNRQNHQAPTPPPSQPIQQQIPQMPPPGYPGQPMGMQLPNFPANPQASVAGALPHFSQIWTTGQFDGQAGQMMMLNAQGQPVQIPNGQAAAMAFFQPQLQQLQQQAQQVQQQQSSEQTAASSASSDQMTTTFNGSPQASVSPHLNSASPSLTGDQPQSTGAPPTYEQQQQQQQQQQHQQHFEHWALQQQLEQQKQQLFQHDSQGVSDGSEAKASPQSQLSGTSSPAPPAQHSVENLEQNQNITSPAGDSNSVGSGNNENQSSAQQQYQSAHNNYNSYANFPWGNFPQQGGAVQQPQGGAAGDGTAGASSTDTNGKPVFSKESIKDSELNHLRNALSEKTKKVQLLEQEVEKAISIIEQLKAENQQLRAHAQAQVQMQAQSQAQAQAHAQAQAQAQAHASNATALNLGLQQSPQTSANSSPAPM